MRITLLLITGFLVGCAAPVRHVYLADQPYPPHHANYPIRIYQGTLPDEPFVEIAVVSFTLKSKLQSRDKAIEAMRAKARELGGEAIINFGQQNRTDAIVPVGGVLMLDIDTTYSGTVIRFVRNNSNNPATTRRITWHN